MCLGINKQLFCAIKPCNFNNIGLTVHTVLWDVGRKCKATVTLPSVGQSEVSMGYSFHQNVFLISWVQMFSIYLMEWLWWIKYMSNEEHLLTGHQANEPFKKLSYRNKYNNTSKSLI